MTTTWFGKFGPQSPVDPEVDGIPTFYECGICNQYHPLNWDGDCRDDNNRLCADDLDEKYNGGWEEVEMPE